MATGIDPHSRSRALRRGVAGGALLLLAAGSCTPTFAVGQLGTLRYAGRVKGAVPLNLLPPVADPAGNVYVLNGAPTLPESHVYVGFAGGGWAASCNATKGDKFGAHGWAGFAATRQWYWSGDALVSVSGVDGSCHAVLDRDPATGADLLFRGVLPGVRNLSERTSLVALVQSPDDPTPFSAMVDLDNEFLTNVAPFDPADAQDVAVVGVGGSREQETGVVLVQYQKGGTPKLEARYFDAEANLTDVVPISGGPFAPYAVAGYLQLAAGGLVAGLVATGNEDGSLNLVTFTRSGGAVAEVQGMQPVGVHAWGGNLWLVGEASSAPVVAAIDSTGHVGGASPWNASLQVVNALGTTTPVEDDRSLPSRATSWTGVRTATGDFPFLHAHALTEQAPSTTLWVFAGPSVAGSAIPLTAFAMAPVGVSYP